MKINKILVPLDFSGCAINALRIAVKIAQQHEASLEIINAYHSPTVHTSAMTAGVFVQPFVGEYENGIQDDLFQNLLMDVPELSTVYYETNKIKAITADAIYTSIEKNNIDLVIMGTNQKHTPLEKLVGSVSANVIRFSSVPVLVIPENVSSMDIRSIGFAVDLRRIIDMDRLKILKVLAKATDAKIEIFHISHKDDVHHMVENAQERMRLLDALADVKHSYVWVNEEDILEGIFDFIENREVDMLAMLPRHHSVWDSVLHGSLTKKIALKTRVPLLAIHE